MNTVQSDSSPFKFLMFVNTKIQMKNGWRMKIKDLGSK